MKVVGIVETRSFVFVEYDKFYLCSVKSNNFIFIKCKKLYLCFCWV